MRTSPTPGVAPHGSLCPDRGGGMVSTSTSITFYRLATAAGEHAAGARRGDAHTQRTGLPDRLG